MCVCEIERERERDKSLTLLCFHTQAVLMQSREQVAEELSRLQRDNESLQGKHRLHLALQQQEAFQLPATTEV